jgi:hypothetical protein
MFAATLVDTCQSRGKRTRPLGPNAESTVAIVLVNVPEGTEEGSHLACFVDRPESLFDRW